MEGRRPQYSQDGIDFVVLFASRFLNVHISGYKPLLMEPPAEEIDPNGEEAPQHIVLKPQLDGDPLLTVGFVKLEGRSAVLRSYDYMRAMHRQHDGTRPFHVDQAHYQSFFDSALEFLQERGMQVDIESGPSPAELPATKTAKAPAGKLASLSFSN